MLASVASSMSLFDSNSPMVKPRWFIVGFMVALGRVTAPISIIWPGGIPGTHQEKGIDWDHGALVFSDVYLSQYINQY